EKTLGPASYRALIVDAFVNTPTHPLKTAMPLATARRILAMAKAGLPIIVVGAAPDQTPGANGDDTALRATIAELLAESSVKRVATEADVPALLDQLGIRPDAKPDAPSTLFSLHRTDQRTDTDYYYFYNEGFDQTVRGTIFELPT